MRDEEYRTSPRIKPHDKEESFSWSKEKTKVDDENKKSHLYIVYPNQNWSKEVKDRIKNKYKFNWNLDHWERKDSIDEDTMHEIIMDGILVEE